MKLDRRFSIGYLVRGVAIVALEVFGVYRKGQGDTITENWRWLDSKAWGPCKWILRVFTVGLLAWVALHFGGNW